jgi:hypothetical protein
MRRHIAVAVALAALAAAAPASAHQGNPDFLSEVGAVEPTVDGISVEVLNRDDRLLLHNTTGEDVVILGYEDEPYARISADGTVEVNENSEAYYLNEDRFAKVDVPAGLDAETPPRWKEISRSGRFEWHDHRAHWMGEGRPPQVTDPDVRTKVFDWSVPMRVGDRPGAIRGTLTWTPSAGGGVPTAAIFALAAVLILAFLAVFAFRRRRDAPAGEAW